MIGFISTSVKSSLNHTYYSAMVDLHNLQFTFAHALGSSVSTSGLLATDLNTETSTQTIMKSPCHFLFSHPGTSELN
jgi:hypothetical protein